MLAQLSDLCKTRGADNRGDRYDLGEQAQEALDYYPSMPEEAVYETKF